MTAPPLRQRWHAARRRWRHSLRWRLVTLFVLLALATTAIFLVAMQSALRTGWQGWVRPLVADYVDRLAAEIGSPPDAARAAAIAARLPLTVRIDGPTLQYDSHPGRRHDADAAEADDPFGEPADQRGPAGWSMQRQSADGHRIRFGLAAPAADARPRGVAWGALAALLLITLLAYAYVRHLLKPLDAIGQGAARFGAGDFGQPIAARRDDELGELAGRVNAMASSLKDRLDAKRALLLAISHELRSPLTRARLNAELVAEGEHRDALLRDLAEMRDLITDLLESERLATGHDALQTEPADLAALVREVADGVAQGRALNLRLDEQLGPQRVDPTRLKLLARNLIDNALRHGGQADAAPEVRLARGAGDTIELSVRDHGPGVAAEHLPHLAEPFYRTDAARTRAAGGVGLGLTLCRLVAQAHGGELRIDPAQPGLRVTARWPVRRV
jgi:signal transduction histidine kinase